MHMLQSGAFAAKLRLQIDGNMSSAFNRCAGTFESTEAAKGTYETRKHTVELRHVP